MTSPITCLQYNSIYNTLLLLLIFVVLTLLGTMTEMDSTEAFVGAIGTPNSINNNKNENRGMSNNNEIDLNIDNIGSTLNGGDSNNCNAAVDPAVHSVPLLLLPVDESKLNKKELPSMKLGETMKFDQMGPVIINTDGTTRRISNWDTLTEREREVTWKRIRKRNEERREILLQQQNQQQVDEVEQGKES